MRPRGSTTASSAGLNFISATEFMRPCVLDDRAPKSSMPLRVITHSYWNLGNRNPLVAALPTDLPSIGSRLGNPAPGTALPRSRGWDMNEAGVRESGIGGRPLLSWQLNDWGNPQVKLYAGRGGLPPDNGKLHSSLGHFPIAPDPKTARRKKPFSTVRQLRR